MRFTTPVGLPQGSVRASSSLHSRSGGHMRPRAPMCFRSSFEWARTKGRRARAARLRGVVDTMVSLWVNLMGVVSKALEETLGWGERLGIRGREDGLNYIVPLL